MPVEILGDLNEWAEKAKEMLHESIKESIKEKVDAVVAVAKELAPVDKGTLRDNIEGKVSSGGHYGVVKIDSKKVPYAFMVHFGTEKMPPRPFLYQATEHNGNLAEEIRKKLQEKSNA